MIESTIVRDLRFGWRSLSRARAFTITALVALALGVGGTAAIFSVVDAVLLKPLPLGDPERLVAILHHRSNPVSPANFLDWRRQSSSFERIGAAESWSPNATGDGAPEKIQGLRLTTDALLLAGVHPALGRLFAEGEDESGREFEAVLSWGLWQRRFGADGGIVGRPIELDGHSYTVVGVMPPNFDFPMFWAHDVQLWAPLALGSRVADRGGQSLRVLAKLRRGVSLASARAEFAGITAGLEREYPGTNRDVHVYPLCDLVVGDVGPALLVLFGAVGFVLLLACANVAHMLLARGAAREREMTIRAALGAGQKRLMRQLITESLLLGTIGGALGLTLAAYGVHALVALAGSGIPRIGEIRLDVRVVLFTCALSLVTGLIFGVAPAMRFSRARLTDSLREGGRAGIGARQHRLRDLLVASEFALALILLTGAGLAIRTFIALRNIDPGFDPGGVVTMIVSFTGTAEASPERRVAFIGQLLDRIRALPGVGTASAINHVPIVGDNWGLPFFIEGRSVPQPGDAPTATYRVVLPGYFTTMGIPLLRGRDVAATDRLGASPVVVINEFMARRYWPGENPIGKRFSLERPNANTAWMTVIGVTKNTVRSDWSAPPEEEIFVPWLQESNYLTNRAPHVGYLSLVIRARCGEHSSACETAALVPAIRSTVWSFDKNLPISEVRTMNEVVRLANARPRFTFVLLATFACVALILAAVGVYGVMSYAVSRRTHEIGVRIALGAAPALVVRMIVREGMTVALSGAAVGLSGALGLTGSMTSLLYGVDAKDPVTFGIVSLTLIGVALLATYLPARQAARTDPLNALRTD